MLKAITQTFLIICTSFPKTSLRVTDAVLQLLVYPLCSHLQIQKEASLEHNSDTASAWMVMGLYMVIAHAFLIFNRS